MRVGFLVDNVSASQENFTLINAMNRISREVIDVDPVLFFNNVSPPCMDVRFATMSVVNAYAYDGILGATNLVNAKRISSFVGTKPRIFYVWDLEWLRIRDKYYEELAAIYQNPRLELIVRSDDHRKVVERSWDRPVKAVIPDFNIRKIIDVCYEQS